MRNSKCSILQCLYRSGLISQPNHPHLSHLIYHTFCGPHLEDFAICDNSLRDKQVTPVYPSIWSPPKTPVKRSYSSTNHPPSHKVPGGPHSQHPMVPMAARTSLHQGLRTWSIIRAMRGEITSTRLGVQPSATSVDAFSWRLHQSNMNDKTSQQILSPKLVGSHTKTSFPPYMYLTASTCSGHSCNGEHLSFSRAQETAASKVTLTNDIIF